jgi:hypothetical protein
MVFTASKIMRCRLDATLRTAPEFQEVTENEDDEGYSPEIRWLGQSIKNAAGGMTVDMLTSLVPQSRQVCAPR